jgi:hypothetical protein
MGYRQFGPVNNTHLSTRSDITNRNFLSRPIDSCFKSKRSTTVLSAVDTITEPATAEEWKLAPYAWADINSKTA